MKELRLLTESMKIPIQNASMIQEISLAKNISSTKIQVLKQRSLMFIHKITYLALLRTKFQITVTRNLRLTHTECITNLIHNGNLNAKQLTLPMMQLVKVNRLETLLISNLSSS